MIRISRNINLLIARGIILIKLGELNKRLLPDLGFFQGLRSHNFMSETESQFLKPEISKEKSPEKNLEKRERIEIIERLPLTSKNKMELLLTFLEKKPAAFFDTKEWLPAYLSPEQRKIIKKESPIIYKEVMERQYEYEF